MTARRHQALWLRWTWRDLRRHWIAVVAIAVVIAIGTGVYAGLGSTATWRRLSNDASFAELRMHDLRAELSPGTFTDEGTLAAVVDRLPSAEAVTGVEERLLVDAQIDASTPGEVILVNGRVVGIGDPTTAAVDALWVRDGSGDGAVLEVKFADYYDLPTAGSIDLVGGRSLEYVGLGVAPEEFFVVGQEGSILAQADFANVYVDLAAAQQLAGRPGQVNDVVLTLRPGVDRDVVQRELVAALDELPDVGATVTDRDEAEAFRVLYEDIDNDQQTWNLLSGLVLFAAVVAAFNLISRIVEAQRREIGIGAALGLGRWELARRPLLIGAQIAVLGVVFGLAIGLLVGLAMADLLASFLPLPDQRTPFQLGVFAQAAALGFAVPLVAAAIPVWRAVRVEPIEAIRTGHLSAKGGRLTGWTRRVRLPGSSLTQLPLRNALRTPRRTILTVVGIGAAIAALVAVLGLLDTITRSIDRAEQELTQGEPDRLLVGLDTFHPVESDVVAGIVAAPSVGSVDASLRLPAVALGEGDDIDLVIEVLDLDTAGWTPTLIAEATGGPHGGLVLAEKAATDLGVGPGDAVSVRHPSRAPDGGFAIAETSFAVSGIHPNPIRTFAFLDEGTADELGFAGWTNSLSVSPAAGADRTDVQRELFDLPGVATAQPVARVAEVFDEAMEQFVGFLLITEVAVLILALLIAVNSARISIEERRREHATMRAFGLRLRTIVGLVVREATLIGVGATVVGVLAGGFALRWLLDSVSERTLPDLLLAPELSTTTLVVAVVVGVLAAVLAPLLLVRRIRRMDIPSTLRVME
ncbi:MAG: FtsX-like permease family protein [Actinomycetota bacterium]